MGQFYTIVFGFAILLYKTYGVVYGKRGTKKEAS